MLLNSYVVLGSSIIFTVVSQFLLKKGALLLKTEGHWSVRTFFLFIMDIVKNPYIISGVILYVLTFILWLIVLSRLKLSIVYPITVLNIVLVTIISSLFLKEALSSMQLASIIMICLGIFFLTH